MAFKIFLKTCILHQRKVRKMGSLGPEDTAPTAWEQWSLPDDTQLYPEMILVCLFRLASENAAFLAGVSAPSSHP